MYRSRSVAHSRKRPRAKAIQAPTREKRPWTKHAAWAVATPPFGSLSRPKGSWGRYRPMALIQCQMFCPRSRKLRNQNLERRTAVSFIKKPPETVTREFQFEEPLANTLDS